MVLLCFVFYGDVTQIRLRLIGCEPDNYRQIEELRIKKG